MKAGIESLRSLMGLVGLAGLLAVGQVLSRRIFLDATEYPTLRSLGMERMQLLAVRTGGADRSD